MRSLLRKTEIIDAQEDETVRSKAFTAAYNFLMDPTRTPPVADAGYYGLRSDARALGLAPCSNNSRVNAARSGVW